ncbi:retinoid-inducible serine carboxypeptidase-like [Palaemon carinicauda]|uniref:retinoid-inducible serine carboxypeptidase-like n=1 Tax=Palaemon carinicauda TaxID=392227 RepID=UPI0035B630EC
MKCLPLLCLVSVAVAASVKTNAPLDEEFGYVTVRPGAHMFWALYHTDQTGDYTTYPLIMWLQGGPGGSGVGYGNFMELGPYDINGNLRPHAWTKKANLLFVDNPVGTGYSYAEDYDKFTTDNDQIAKDLVVLVKEVFKTNTDLERMPFFVYAESYGGKMTVDFALAFDAAIKNGEVVSDFRGVALGDSWISPMDSVNTWGSYLYHMGFVNRKGLAAIDAAAAKTQHEVDLGNWEAATTEWGNTEFVVMDVAHDVNFYNVHAEEDIYMAKTNKKPHSIDLSYMSPQVRHLYQHHVLSHYGQPNDALHDFMNGDQAKRWNIPPEVVWDSQGGTVFDRLAGDFMKPVIDSVTKLLTETNLHVAVFTGNLDLICDTPGTYNWIENMEWPGKPDWLAAANVDLHVGSYSYQAATVQHSGQFSLFTIFRSGHMVPIDAPEIALVMIDQITSFTNEAKEKQEDKAQLAPTAEVKQDTVQSEESPRPSSPTESKAEAPKPSPTKTEAEAPKEEIKDDVHKEKIAKVQAKPHSTKVHKTRRATGKTHGSKPGADVVQVHSDTPTAMNNLRTVRA